jgi:hypothetical protein
MVRIVVMCVMGVVCAGVVGCKSENTAGKVAPLAAPRSVASTAEGEFRYLVVDGEPTMAWYPPGGKQVVLMRIDSRWVCELPGDAGGPPKCSAQQSAKTECASCDLTAVCPCVDQRCLPMCVQNASAVFPGLHDPAPAKP